jgi:hypothetical protein
MNVKFTYSPEGGSPRTWSFDPENPPWDLCYVTETETGWPWQEFMDKLAHGSHIALRAFVYAFRKRDEPRLSIDGVRVTFGEVDIDEAPEPKPKPKKAAKGEGEA